MQILQNQRKFRESLRGMVSSSFARATSTKTSSRAKVLFQSRAKTITSIDSPNQRTAAKRLLRQEKKDWISETKFKIVSLKRQKNIWILECDRPQSSHPTETSLLWLNRVTKTHSGTVIMQAWRGESCKQSSYKARTPMAVHKTLCKVCYGRYRLQSENRFLLSRQKLSKRMKKTASPLQKRRILTKKTWMSTPIDWWVSVRLTSTLYIVLHRGSTSTMKEVIQ